MKLRKGMTVLELMTSIGVLVIVVSAAALLTFAALRTERLAATEFNLQVATRVLLDDVSHRIRYASAVYIMPESSFNSTNIDIFADAIYNTSTSFLSAGWNYYGIIDNHIVHLRWDEANNQHGVQRVFHNPHNEFDFGLEFFQLDGSSMDDHLVNFHLTAVRDGNTQPDINILTAANAFSAMQVVDWSSDVSPGRAIAYRLDEIEMSQDVPLTRVAIVLDLSGSMTRSTSSNHDYNNGNHPNSRMFALRSASRQLLVALQDVENVEVTIIPYSTTANFGTLCDSTSTGVVYRNLLNSLFGTTHTFVPLYENFQALNNVINTMPLGGNTNIADGLRRAYFAITDAPVPTCGRDVRYIVVFMTDGQPNTAPIVIPPPGPGIASRTWLQERNAALNPSTFFLYRNPNGTLDLTDHNTSGSPLSGGSTIATNRANRFGRYNSARTTLITDNTVLRDTSANRESSRVLARSNFTGTNTNVNNANAALVRQHIIYPANDHFASLLLTQTSDVFFVALSPEVVQPNGDLFPSIQRLSDSLGVDMPFTATSYAELFDAFDTIAELIVADLWHALGPNLVPPTN